MNHDCVTADDIVDCIVIASVQRRINRNVVVRYAGDLIAARQRPADGYVAVVNIGASSALGGDARRRVGRYAYRKGLIDPLRVEYARSARVARAHQNARSGCIRRTAAGRDRIPANEHLSGTADGALAKYGMRCIVRNAHGQGLPAAGHGSAVCVIGNVDKHRRRAPLRGQCCICRHNNRAVGIIQVAVYAGTPAIEAFAFRRGNGRRIVCFHLRLRVFAVGIAIRRRGSVCAVA